MARLDRRRDRDVPAPAGSSRRGNPAKRSSRVRTRRPSMASDAISRTGRIGAWPHPPAPPWGSFLKQGRASSKAGSGAPCLCRVPAFGQSAEPAEGSDSLPGPLERRAEGAPGPARPARRRTRTPAADACNPGMFTATLLPDGPMARAFVRQGAASAAASGRPARRGAGQRCDGALSGLSMTRGTGGQSPLCRDLAVRRCRRASMLSRDPGSKNATPSPRRRSAASGQRPRIPY